jgi:hypothetical protein
MLFTLEKIMGNFMSTNFPKPLSAQGVPTLQPTLVDGKRPHGRSSSWAPSFLNSTVQSKDASADQPRVALLHLSSFGVESAQGAVLVNADLDAAKEQYRQKSQELDSAIQARDGLVDLGMPAVLARMNEEIRKMTSKLAEIQREVRRLEQQGGGSSGNA